MAFVAFYTEGNEWKKKTYDSILFLSFLEYLPFEGCPNEAWPFIWTDCNPLYPRMIWLKLSLWFLLREDFKKMSQILIISTSKSVQQFILTNWNHLYPIMFCGKFGWNSGEVENVKILKMDIIQKVEKFTWAFS